jgi:hypothetical protein
MFQKVKNFKLNFLETPKKQLLAYYSRTLSRKVLFFFYIFIAAIKPKERLDYPIIFETFNFYDLRFNRIVNFHTILILYTVLIPLRSTL